MQIKGMRWEQVETPIDANTIIELEVTDNQGNTYFIDDFSYVEYDDFYVATESLFDQFIDYLEDDCEGDFEEIENNAIEIYSMEEGRMPLDAIQSDFSKIFSLLHTIMGDFDETEALKLGSAEKYIEPLLQIEF